MNTFHKTVSRLRRRGFTNLQFQKASLTDQNIWLRATSPTFSLTCHDIKELTGGSLYTFGVDYTNQLYLNILI